MTSPKHTCHAIGCETDIPARLHMCKIHWYRVPKALRDALWAEYEPGQERRKDPTPEYLVAAERCICAVAVKEGRMTEADAFIRIDRMAAAAPMVAEVLPLLYADGAE